MLTPTDLAVDYICANQRRKASRPLRLLESLKPQPVRLCDSVWKSRS
jgi:hypothetical protein